MEGVRAMLNPWAGAVFREKVCPLLFLLLLLLFMREGRAYDFALFYQVRAVEVSVPIPETHASGAESQDLRAIGLEKAKKVAFKRLLRRLLTKADRNTHKLFLETLLQDRARFIERATVLSEAYRSTALWLSVDVFFSRKEVRTALRQEKLSFSEVLHPPLLFLVREISLSLSASLQGAFESLLQRLLSEEARALGLSVVTLLGDMEDLTHLSWDKAAAGDLSLYQWALSRYDAGRVWAVSARLKPLLKGSGEGKPLRYAAKVQLLGGHSDQTKPAPPVLLYAKVTGTRSSHGCRENEDPRYCFYPTLVRRLLQKMVDPWIQAHAVNPHLGHTVYLRIIRGSNFVRFSEFIKGLRAVPGLVSVKFLEERATESRLQVEFQGQDVSLQQALVRLGAQVEYVGPVAGLSGPVSPPEVTTSPEEEESLEGAVSLGLFAPSETPVSSDEVSVPLEGVVPPEKTASSGGGAASSEGGAASSEVLIPSEASSSLHTATPPLVEILLRLP